MRLILEDGTSYAPEGTLLFADVTVDPATGSQVLRAVFPNPDGLLLPGMLVRARLVEGTVQAMLVPQRAVSRDERGRAIAMVVGDRHAIELCLSTEIRGNATQMQHGDEYVNQINGYLGF